MTYLDLIRRFWELDMTWQFSCCETRLYFYLTETANRLGWPDSFTHSDARTSANVGVSRDSLRTAKNRLSQAGLIGFTGGGNGKGDKCRYRLRCERMAPKGNPKPKPNPYPCSAPGPDPLPITERQDKTKRKKIKEKSFSPPSAEEFRKYFSDNGYSEETATRAFNGYSVADWHDSQGNAIRNWKQKCQHVWFKPENRNQQQEKQRYADE